MREVYIFSSLHTGVTKQNGIHYIVRLNYIYDCTFAFFQQLQTLRNFKIKKLMYKLFYTRVVYIKFTPILEK